MRRSTPVSTIRTGASKTTPTPLRRSPRLQRRIWVCGVLMLEALVIAGLVAAPFSSAVLFLPGRHRARATGAWAALWRVILAIAGSVVLATAAAGVLYLLNATEGNIILGGAAVVAAGLLLWVPTISSTSRDQAIFVDHATGASLLSYAVLAENDRLW